MSRARRCRPVAAKAPRRCVRPSAPLKFGRTGTPPCRRALPDTGGAGSGGGLAAEADGRRDAVGCKARTSFVGPPAPPCCALARLVPFLTDCLQRVPVQVPVPGIPNAASAAACLRPPRHGASGMSCPHRQNPFPAGRPASWYGVVFKSPRPADSAPAWRRYASAGAAPIRPRDRSQAPGLKRGRAPTGGSAPTRILRQSATDPRRALPAITCRHAKSGLAVKRIGRLLWFLVPWGALLRHPDSGVRTGRGASPSLAC